MDHAAASQPVPVFGEPVVGEENRDGREGTGLPTAHELAYDKYNFFVIGDSPTERPSDAVVAIAAGANGVGLCFIRGATLPDPKGVLLGSGS